MEPRAFNCFCPKALAGIGRMADTIEDRSIIIEMRRRAPSEIVEQLRQDKLNLDYLQRLCARWSADNLQALKDSDPAVPSELHDRAADNWRPLLAIADLAGGEWPARARFAARKLTIRGDDQDSIQTLLLSDIQKIIEQKPYLKSTELSAALAEIDDHPWAEWKHGRAMTAVQLARQLAPFNLHPKAIRVTHNLVIKGYETAQFEETFARYLPKSQLPTVTELQTSKAKGCEVNVSVTRNAVVTAAPVTDISAVTDQIVQNIEKSRVCNHVTDPRGISPSLKDAEYF